MEPFESIHERALAYLNEPPADLYHRYMASLMRAAGGGELARLVAAQREANDLQRRVWIAWLVAAYEHEMSVWATRRVGTGMGRGADGRS